MMSAAMSWSFAVAVLRGPAQEIECDGRGAALLGHQDADGLVDDAAGNHGLGQLRLELGLTGLPQGNRQCRRALPGERLSLLTLRTREGARAGRVQVQR